MKIASRIYAIALPASILPFLFNVSSNSLASDIFTMSQSNIASLDRAEIKYIKSTNLNIENLLFYSGYFKSAICKAEDRCLKIRYVSDRNNPNGIYPLFLDIIGVNKSSSLILLSNKNFKITESGSKDNERTSISVEHGTSKTQIVIGRNGFEIETILPRETKF